MKPDRAYAVTAGIGVLALSLLVAGCGGSGNPMGPSPIGGNNLTPNGLQMNQSAELPNGASPDRKHHLFCRPVLLSQNFNGQRIPRTYWILFTSVTQFPGNQGPARVEMKDSVIRFSDGFHNFAIRGPDMTFTLHSGSRVDLDFSPASKHALAFWAMHAPQMTAGNDFLNNIAWHVTRSIPGNVQNVSWAARFFSRSDITQMHWQWGAAIYTRLTDKYGRLRIKPLDDNHYPPFNNDRAGTPERFKAFVTQGGTGGGGNNYTGIGGPTLNVTPCR